MERTYDIAIAGGGFSGLMVAAQTARANPGVRIAWLDGRGRFARGTAYATTELCHLLNVPAKVMSAWPDAPDDFANWLARQHPNYQPDDFVPRKIYGDYLGDIAAQMHRHAAVTEFPADAIHATKNENGFTLTLTNNTTIQTKNLVLALGNPPPRPLNGPTQENFVSDFWEWRLAGGLVPANLDALLVILGTGLTTVDAVLSARTDGYDDEIILISNHAYLPQPHAPFTPIEWTDILKTRPTARHYWHCFAAAYRQSPENWRGLVDGVRPYTPALWQALSETEKTRFARHLLPLWNVHRHRLPPATAEKLRTDKNLTLLSGRIANAESNGTLNIQRRHGAAETLHTGMLLNCTGPNFRTMIKDSPLLHSLSTQNLIQPGPLGWGIATPTAPGLFALGPLLRGEQLETTAVREARQQAQQIAQSIM